MALAGASSVTRRSALFGVKAFTTIVRDGVTASGEVPFAARTVNVNEPVTVGGPDNTPAPVKVNPVGRTPESMVNVIGVEPNAVNVYGAYAAFTTTGDCGMEFTNTGATGAAFTTIVRVGVTALGNVPLAAVTVNVNVPAVVGVPESAPAELNVSPAGNAPELTVNVIGVVPVAVNV